MLTYQGSIPRNLYFSTRNGIKTTNPTHLPQIAGICITHSLNWIMNQNQFQFSLFTQLLKTIYSRARYRYTPQVATPFNMFVLVCLTSSYVMGKVSCFERVYTKRKRLINEFLWKINMKVNLFGFKEKLLTENLKFLIKIQKFFKKIQVFLMKI